MRVIFSNSAVALICGIAIMLTCAVTAAGDLEPDAPPAPTMKTLDEVLPSWSQDLQCDASACPRFVEVFSGAGILDLETGLVWKTVSTAANFAYSNDAPSNAINVCAGAINGGKSAWRVPKLPELESLAAFFGQMRSNIPGTVFDLVVDDEFYWTSTPYDFDPTEVWVVELSNSALTPSFTTDKLSKTSAAKLICVRGPGY